MDSLIKVVAAGLLCLALAPSAAQTEVRNDLPKRFETLYQYAERGDADAQFTIGRVYVQSEHLPNALEQARYWLTRSAEQQHAQAMLQLGRLFQAAQAAFQDNAEAFKWYLRAAELGLPAAQSQVGYFYLSGLGDVKQDCGLALNWFEQAHARQHPGADANIVWLLSTCPDDEVRDGSRALRMATDIAYRQGRTTANNLDNLAAAYAELGDFRSAWEVQEDALELMPDDSPSRAEFEAHLASYKANTRWREIAEGN
jgi:TPR repeat protein